MLAVKGVYTGAKTVQLETVAPLCAGYEVIVTFVHPTGQDEKYGNEMGREPIIIPPEIQGKITEEMLGKPFIHTNGWKFDRDEANER